MGIKAAKDAVDVGIIVADIAASLKFYQDLLGLEKVQEMPLPFGTMHRMAFGQSFIKLVDPNDVPAAGPSGLLASRGIRYITFQVSNIDEIWAACEAAKVPIEWAKGELAPGVTIAMVRDPDGNVVEFVERA